MYPKNCGGSGSLQPHIHPESYSSLHSSFVEHSIGYVLPDLSGSSSTQRLHSPPIMSCGEVSATNASTEMKMSSRTKIEIFAASGPEPGSSKVMKMISFVWSRFEATRSLIVASKSGHETSPSPSASYVLIHVDARMCSHSFTSARSVSSTGLRSRNTCLMSWYFTRAEPFGRQRRKARRTAASSTRSSGRTTEAPG